MPWAGQCLLILFIPEQEGIWEEGGTVFLSDSLQIARVIEELCADILNPLKSLRLQIEADHSFFSKFWPGKIRMWFLLSSFFFCPCTYKLNFFCLKTNNEFLMALWEIDMCFTANPF